MSIHSLGISIIPHYLLVVSNFMIEFWQIQDMDNKEILNF